MSTEPVIDALLAMDGPPVPPADICGRRLQRHTTRTMAFARALYADGEGYTLVEIARHFAQQGTVIHVSTIREWVVPGQAEARRAWQRQAKAAGRVNRKPESRRHWSPDKEARLLKRGLEFRAADPPVPYSAISIIFARYEHAKMAPDTIRGWLTANGAPRDERKVRDLSAMKADGRIPTRKAAA